MAAMKWWGWGGQGVEFSHHDKPDLAPFIVQVIGVNVDMKSAPPLGFDELRIPDPTLPNPLRKALEHAVTSEFVSIDSLDRVVHARGKSLRDLIWQRSGKLPRVPDVIVRPGDEE